MVFKSGPSTAPVRGSGNRHNDCSRDKSDPIIAWHHPVKGHGEHLD